MEYLLLILNSFLSIVAIFIAGYVKKRADNIATKKDIQSITEKIETVKAKLQIDTKGTIDFKSDQRATVLNFYDSFVNWFYVVLKLENVTVDEENIEEIKKYQTKIDNAYTSLILNERRMYLYLSDDEDIQRTALCLIEEGIKEEKIVRDFLTGIYYEYEDLYHYHKILKEGGQIYPIDLSKLNEKIDSQWKAMEDKCDLIDEKVDPILEKYITLAKKYIKVDIT
jgi:hypothetical protein